jgi:hypothetical protein
MSYATNPYLNQQGLLFVGLNGGSAPTPVTPGTAKGQCLKYNPTITNGVSWEDALTFDNIAYPTTVTYTVKVTDQLVYAKSSAAGSITLPTAPPEGWSVYIKDVTGSAGTNTITVSAAVNIDGASSYAITTSYGYARFVYSATNSLWYTV